MPYGAPTAMQSSQGVKNVYDRRMRDDEPRVVWRRSLVNHERYLHLETERRLDRKSVTDVEQIVRVNRVNCGWMVGPAAFEPIEASRSQWRRLMARDVAVQISEFAAFDSSDRRLRSLGIPEDIGANGWIATPFSGKLMLIPSLTLLLAIAFPGVPVWKRLRHPLSMDLMSRRSPEDACVVEIAREATVRSGLILKGASLYTLAFWLEENRLPSLHRALEGFGRPGWALAMPDRREWLNLAFDGYEHDDLIVVQRIRPLHSARFFPGDWERVKFVDANGEVNSALQHRPYMTYAEGRGPAPEHQARRDYRPHEARWPQSGK